MTREEREFPDAGSVIVLTAAAEGAAFAGMAFGRGSGSEFREIYRDAIAADIERGQVERAGPW